jgi:hypothetical protein
MNVSKRRHRFPMQQGMISDATGYDRKLLLPGLIIAALALCVTLHAQNPAPAAPPAVLPTVDVKEIEALANQKFAREPGDLLNHLQRVGNTEPASLSLADRFILRFVTGDWKAVGTELAGMPPELSKKIYEKMLADLTGSQKPNMQIDDILGLADAAPGEFTSGQLQRLGQLLNAAVPARESYWLVDRLNKGTGKLGGKDPLKRQTAGRLLMFTNMKDLARDYLPPREEVEKMPDDGLKRELLSYLATQEDREQAQAAEVQRIWDENIVVFMKPIVTRIDQNDVNRAGSVIAKIVTQVPSGTVRSVLSDILKSNPDAALQLVSAIARKVVGDRSGDLATRSDNLDLQATIANLLADRVPAGDRTWDRIFEMMADHWVSEADASYAETTSSNQYKNKFVEPEELLGVAPAGKWMERLASGIRDRIDASSSRLILTGTRFDQAAERIVEIGKRNPAAGAALAEDFLLAWGKAHNPQLPESLRKKYNLAEGARIPVTPIMMDKNIDSLAKMMSQFRAAGLTPKDPAKVVDAFDLAYSSAETYRSSHIEKVFGPMAKMEEDVFFLIMSRMNANLGARWRKIEVQDAALTRRDQTETLGMVREGYTTALKMIEDWQGGHPDAWRALSLAGTLLTDWGDFEYFQQLVAGDPRARLVVFKEKNLTAQDYFDRSAAAYAKQVDKLSPGEYTVDAYLAWFNGLLGIGSNGEINLSKAMNRAALDTIRERILGMPGSAGKAHLGLFAKVTNARLNDVNNPLHEDLRYRYLAASMVIAKDDPFSFGAAKKLDYFDELMKEVRLETRVDGPNTVGRDEDFGIVLSIVHTEAMGRAAKFEQYLSNDPAAGGFKPTKSSNVKTMSEAQGPRDQLELNIREAMEPFFDISSIVFAAMDVKARPTAQAGWEETPLAYLQVRAKDASVDKIPPIELALKFVDMTGPVSIPAESAETVIKVATDDAAPARPVSNIAIEQTLDTRQLSINGTLALEIKATATGLVPDLEQLLTLPGDDVPIAVKHINPHEGLQIKELNTWGDAIAPVSERLWTLTLDGDAVRAADGPIEFRFPAPKLAETAVTYQTYEDQDLKPLTEPLVKLGREITPAVIVAEAKRIPLEWIAGAAGAVLLIVLLVIFALSRKGKEKPVRARDVFHLPKEIDGFSVVALLRRLGNSPLVSLKEAQRQDLQREIQRIEQACFGEKSGLPESDLRGIATKWLRQTT